MVLLPIYFLRLIKSALKVEIVVGRFMQILTASVPTMVIEGDHEIEKHADNQMFTAYSSRFAFPSNESGSTLYYSFNAGGIHFVMLGAYVAYNKSCKSQIHPAFFLLFFLMVFSFCEVGLCMNFFVIVLYMNSLDCS